MFEVSVIEARQGDVLITKDNRKFKVRQGVYEKLFCCDGSTESRKVIEVALGDIVLVDDVVSVQRRYQPGDWRAA